MVTGAAALLLDACERDRRGLHGRRGHGSSGKGWYNARAKSWGGYDADRRSRRTCRSPLELKALLMSSAETGILDDALTGEPAPITRIGAGELRVDRAARSAAAAWDAQTGGGISFGHIDVADDYVRLTRTMRIRNFSDQEIYFRVTPTFRFDDETNGAVSLSAPRFVRVDDDDAELEIELTIDASRLPGNFMNSGSEGANPTALTRNEYDGYIELRPLSRRGHGHGRYGRDDRGHRGSEADVELAALDLNVPWHVLPRRAARLEPATTRLQGGGFPELIALSNTGAGTAQNDAYALIALSDDLPEGGRGEQSPTPDIAAVGINTFPVPPGFCSLEASFIWVFAINTHERQRHLVQPVSHQVWLDTDRNGVDDFVVLNRDVSFTGVSDGRQLTWALDLANGTATAFFFAEHATNTGNTVLVICGEQVGLTGTDLLATTVGAAVIAQDF